MITLRKTLFKIQRALVAQSTVEVVPTQPILIKMPKGSNQPVPISEKVKVRACLEAPTLRAKPQ